MKRILYLLGALVFGLAAFHTVMGNLTIFRSVLSEMVFFVGCCIAVIGALIGLFSPTPKPKSYRPKNYFHKNRVKA